MSDNGQQVPPIQDMSDNDAGLSIIYTGGYVPDLAICIDPTDRFYGWLLARNPLDGRWVSLAKMDANATNLHEAREKIATLERELAAERERREAAEAVIHTCQWAMRQPLDGWKGECERKALDEARTHFARYKD